MGFLVSPGVESTETDRTNIIPASSTSVGAFAGHFGWGPSEQIVTVGSEKQLSENFGTPAQGDSTRSFLTAASFLKYSNTLRVSRAIGSGAVNAADSNSILIKNSDHFDTIASLDFAFSAKFPGKLGNSIDVSYAYVAGSEDTSYTDWEYQGLFDSAPNQSLTAQSFGIATNDEIHLVLIDSLGLISGTIGTVLEKYEGLSLASNAKNEDGGTIYYKDVLNTNSSYVYVNTLSDVFAEADTDLSATSVFNVQGEALNSESTIDVPFILTLQTTIEYSGGATSVSSEEFDKVINFKSGYTGSDANNAKLTIRNVAVGSIADREAKGFLKYGTPVDGDTVTIEGVVYTKAAAAGVFEYSTPAELVSLFVGDVSATLVGSDLITLEYVSTGAGGNAIPIVLGVNNDGTME